ncbi:unnamed protein product [Rhodiola kirilowii]
MEHHRRRLRLPLAPLLFFFFLIIIHFVTPYKLPSNYFINCGSDSSASLLGQNYSADIKAFSPAQTYALQSSSFSSAAVQSPYQTARAYTRPFSYKFRISQNGTYLLRLHFNSFSSSPPRNLNLSDAVFHVSVSGTALLSNFTAPATTVIREFLLPINTVNFMLTVDFTPAVGSELAFVNAIEAFAAPDNLISNSVPYLVTRQGNANATYRELQRNMLRKVYRINVGGESLTPENDTLNRYWDADDVFLYTPDAAKNSQFRNLEPLWNVNLSDSYIAPVLVYQSAKELSTNSSNSTWNFDVAKNARHLVRAHFCNIMGDSVNDILFNFFVNGYYGRRISPYNITYFLAVPFYIDFIVDSDQSGVISVSIGPRRESQRKTAFLNGLEIMELMDAPSFSSERQSMSKKTTLLVIVGSVVGGLVLIVILFLGFLIVLRRRRVKKLVKRWPENDGSAYIGLVEASENASTLPNFNLGLRIPISEIIRATNNFDVSLKIGEGGFGKVYRGALQDGTKVAVKRSEPGHGQGRPEFHQEIIILSKIRHVHLVSLIGYCDEMSEMILVYEFMEKGTLREHLYGDLENSRANLSWEKRLDICIGSARGLHYLHTGAVGRILHRDVKPTNILLDGNYVAKVADFGLSSVLDQTHVSTGIKGSFGYMDPEYLRTYELTEKSDVYSFGVVLLEVACARQAINNSLPKEEMNLAEWGMLWHVKGELQKIIDPFLVGKINPNSLRVFGETAAKCLRAAGEDRPTMGEVIWDLEYSLQLQKTGGPRQPHEYSSTTGGSSLDLQMMMLQRLPSHSMKMDEDMSMTFNDSEETSASGIFSQLKMEGPR